MAPLGGLLSSPVTSLQYIERSLKLRTSPSHARLKRPDNACSHNGGIDASVFTFFAKMPSKDGSCSSSGPAAIAGCSGWSGAGAADGTVVAGGAVVAVAAAAAVAIAGRGVRGRTAFWAGGRRCVRTASRKHAGHVCFFFFFYDVKKNKPVCHVRKQDCNGRPSNHAPPPRWHAPCSARRSGRSSVHWCSPGGRVCVITCGSLSSRCFSMCLQSASALSSSLCGQVLIGQHAFASRHGTLRGVGSASAGLAGGDASLVCWTAVSVRFFLALGGAPHPPV
jgi:hypothetical protein